MIYKSFLQRRFDQTHNLQSLSEEITSENSNNPEQEYLKEGKTKTFYLFLHCSFGEVIDHIIFSTALFSLDQSLRLFDMQVIKLDLDWGKLGVKQGFRMLYQC